MAKYPTSKGWEARDWQEWFSALHGDAEERLRQLVEGEGDAAEHVHEARKMLKRLRAGMRLLCCVVGSKSCETVRGACRDAGRLLSGSRDQTVRLQTFQNVVTAAFEDEPKSVTKAREVLEHEARKAKSIAGDKAKSALKLMKHATMPEARWSQAGSKILGRSLRRLLKRARTEYLDIRDGHSDAFHELRKRVKDLYYTLSALPPDVADETGPALQKLKVLSDILGEENDLAVLIEWFRDRGFTRDEHPKLWKPFEKRIRFLQEQAVKEGRMLGEFKDLALFQR